MKAISFNAFACPENATKYYYQILHQAHAMDFAIPDRLMGFDVRIKVKRENLFAEVMTAFFEASLQFNFEWYVVVQDEQITICEKEKAPSSGENGAEGSLTG